MNGPLIAVIAAAAIFIVLLLIRKRGITTPDKETLPADQTASDTIQLQTPETQEEETLVEEIPLAEPESVEVESPLAPQTSPGAEAVAVTAEKIEAFADATALESDPAVLAEDLADELVDAEPDILLGEELEVPVEGVELETTAAEFAVEEDIILDAPSVAADVAAPALFDLEEIGEEPPLEVVEGLLEEEATILPVQEEPVTTIDEVDLVEPVEETIKEPAPEVMEETVVVSEPTTEPVALAESGEDRVRLSREDYAVRLNAIEEKQRAVLAQVVAQRDEKSRDRLQRELVIMNERLALLDDSYAEDMACYQQVLIDLEEMQAQSNDVGLAQAISEIRTGKIGAAEEYLTNISEQQRPLASEAAFLSGRLAESRVDLQRSMTLYRRAVEREPDNPKYLQAAGKTARILYKYKEALAWLETFVSLSRNDAQTDPVLLAKAQRELAYTYVLSGMHHKAGPLYKESMTTLANRLGQDDPEMAVSWYQIGELQETLGEYDKAVALYKRALDILEKKRGIEHPVLAPILDKLAALCMELEMEKEAVPLYERLLVIREKVLRPTHPQLAMSLNNLAESYRLQRRYAEAEECYQKSLTINETVHGKEHPSVAAVLQELAKLCNSQRKPEEARQYQQRAAALFQKSVEASEQKSGTESLTLEL